MKEWLTTTLIVIGAFGFAAIGTATADDQFGKKSPVITQVTVSFDDPDFGDAVDVLKIVGRNLVGHPETEETKVFLGDRGPLEILRSSDTEIVVQCFVAPDFECNDGDYKLEVSIVRVKKHTRRHWIRSYLKNWEREDDDDDDHEPRKKARSRVASYDLTIGAVGPMGPAGPPGPEGPAGQGGSGTSTLPEVFTVTQSTNTTSATSLSVISTCGADAVRVGCGGATGGDDRALTRLVGVNPIVFLDGSSGCSSDGRYEGSAVWFLSSTSICMRPHAH